jgi:hypothetical protein
LLHRLDHRADLGFASHIDSEPLTTHFRCDSISVFLTEVCDSYKASAALMQRLNQRPANAPGASCHNADLVSYLHD